MNTIALLVLDQVPVFEVATVCEIFGPDRSDLADPWYQLTLCAAGPGPVPVGSGFALLEPAGLDALRTAGTVIVPAPENTGAVPSDAVCDALRAAHAGGARIASICTGAFVLAGAGLLDGRPATTHWMHAGELASRYPAVRVDPGVLYIDDGDILTSAGTSAGIDLCLHLIRIDHGARVANAVARRIVASPHRHGGQAQFIELPDRHQTGRSLGQVLDWAGAHLGNPLTVAGLARRAGMNERTFTRHVKAATGTSPLQWLLSQRLRRAEQLLETTEDSIEWIAHRCGFGTAASMRRHFVRSVGVPPQQYRATFRSGHRHTLDGTPLGSHRLNVRRDSPRPQ
jgi:AraC family transcriptional regulator, transcriptional activator FtrA